MFIQAAKSILLVVSALFPIVDPIGGAPVFLSLTLNYDRDTRRLLARRIAMNSFILMLASFAIGSHVLSFFGISLPVVQVGGGMIVVSAGWALLKQKDENEREAVERSVSGRDVLRDAFYPLTLPLTVGPGSISVAIACYRFWLQELVPLSWRRRSISAMPLRTVWQLYSDRPVPT